MKIREISGRIRKRPNVELGEPVPSEKTRETTFDIRGPGIFPL